MDDQRNRLRGRLRRPFLLQPDVPRRFGATPSHIRASFDQLRLQYQDGALKRCSGCRGGGLEELIGFGSCATFKVIGKAQNLPAAPNAAGLLRIFLFFSCPAKQLG